ncbi:MAG: ferritin family protein [Brevinematales bacterium]|nr:ferritin family protein [Brevinematales bacterium]
MEGLDALVLAFQMEVNGADFYREFAGRVVDPEMKNVLEELAKMEEEHITYISGKIAEIRAKYRNLPDVPGLGIDLYKRRQDTMNVEKHLIEENLGKYFILRMAYYVEKDFFDFYSRAVEKQGGDTKNVFVNLVNWETKHIDKIVNLADQFIKEKGLNPDIYSLEGL